MYSTVLLIHSWLRWLVIMFALIAIVRAILGASRRAPWTRADEIAGKLFLRTFDVQILLGLLLYFWLSPLTRSAFSDFGGAMGVAVTRFWAVEHVFGMVVAMVLAHVAQVRVRRIQNGRRKHMVTAIFYTLALVALLAAIPWPGMPNERPLFRW